MRWLTMASPCAELLPQLQHNDDARRGNGTGDAPNTPNMVTGRFIKKYVMALRCCTRRPSSSAQKSTQTMKRHPAPGHAHGGADAKGRGELGGMRNSLSSQAAKPVSGPAPGT